LQSNAEVTVIFAKQRRDDPPEPTWIQMLIRGLPVFLQVDRVFSFSAFDEVANKSASFYKCSNDSGAKTSTQLKFGPDLYHKWGPTRKPNLV
jgi:hypothetical protein